MASKENNSEVFGSVYQSVQTAASSVCTSELRPHRGNLFQLLQCVKHDREQAMLIAASSLRQKEGRKKALIFSCFHSSQRDMCKKKPRAKDKEREVVFVLSRSRMIWLVCNWTARCCSTWSSSSKIVSWRSLIWFSPSLLFSSRASMLALWSCSCDSNLSWCFCWSASACVHITRFNRIKRRAAGEKFYIGTTQVFFSFWPVTSALNSTTIIKKLVSIYYTFTVMYYTPIANQIH